MNDNMMTHGAGCSQPPPASKHVKPGWLRLTCPECAHVGSAAYVAPVRNLTPEPEPRPITATGYRCRVHHDEPVTWRGTGCPICARTKRKAPQRAELEAS